MNTENGQSHILDEIRDRITPAAIWEAIAEEASELAQAASKMARIIRGENPTDKTIDDAQEDAVEEVTDLYLATSLADLEPSESVFDMKASRMLDRLNSKGWNAMSYLEVNPNSLDDRGRRIYDSAMGSVFDGDEWPEDDESEEDDDDDQDDL